MRTLNLTILASMLTMAAFGACDGKPRSIASNLPADLKGEPDNRPWTWGTAGYQLARINFKVPPGCRVRILRVYGDFLAWPRGKVPEGTTAGALWGLQTTAPDGSNQADLAADNTMIYIQVATSGKSERAPVDFDVTDAGLLQEDAVLVSKMAVWLNDTGLTIHMEASFVVVFRFEDPVSRPLSANGAIAGAR